MTVRSILWAPAAALGFFVGAAAPAAGQGQGFGVGEWNLVTQGGQSVCNVVLTNQFIPQRSAYRAFVRPGGRCVDGRVRGIIIWVVRGNDLKFVDGYGREVASLAQQSPNLYASGDWRLHRVGTGYRPGPGPGYTQPRVYLHQAGEWRLFNRALRSACHVTLTNRALSGRNAFRAIARGGPRCTDPVGRSVYMWAIRGNTLTLIDANGRALASLGEQNPDRYAGGGVVLRRTDRDDDD